MTHNEMREIRLTDACDSHVHVVGPSERFPQVASRSYTAGTANLGLLRAFGKPLGITRFVIVQPSFYGTDNSCLLETLDELLLRALN